MGLETLAIGSLAAGAIGGGVGAFGKLQQGQAESDAAKFQAAVAQVNAQMATQQGQVQAQQQGMKTAQVVGTQRAAQGASGVDVNVGSPVDVRATAAQTGMLDALTILSNAQRKAYGFGLQSQLDTMKAGYAKQAGEIGAFANVLSSASAVGSKWAQFSQSGVF